MSARDLITFGLGPAVSGVGVADWTDSEKQQIRQALGITGTKTATGGGNLDTILTNVSDLATDAELATAVWTGPDTKQINSVSGSVNSVVTGVTIAGTLGSLDALWLKIQKWLRLGFRKDTAVATDHATELDEINTNTGTGTGAYVSTTDSQEALRDNSGGTSLTAQETANAVHNLAPVGTPATGSIGAELDIILNGLTGVGLIPLVYTVTEPGGIIPISGVTVELYTEEACLNCVRRGVTNSFGVITFWLTTAGTYWIKSAKDGYQFELDSETVSA